MCFKKRKFQPKYEKSYPQLKWLKMGIFDLYTDLSTLSTNEKPKFGKKKPVNTEQAFCEVVIKDEKTKKMSNENAKINCVKTISISKQNRRIVAK